MKKIKGSSNYLKNQTIKNLAKAALCLLIFAAAASVLIYRVLSTFQVAILELAGLIFLLVPLIAFYFYLRKYRIFSGGLVGEREVAALLDKTLSDDYFVINDLYLRGGGGDIDHIILGPNGIFVLETKNWSGVISCSGDVWQRLGKRNFSSSPSRQIKRNAAKINQIIDKAPNLRSSGIWVEGIVVFTNKHASLRISNPTVQIFKLPQLPNFILTNRSSQTYSRELLEAVGKEIISQKH